MRWFRSLRGHRGSRRETKNKRFFIFFFLVMSFFIFIFCTYKKNVEQAPPLNNLLPPQTFHFFPFLFFDEKMPWRFMRVCTHTHTRKRNISLSLGNPRCVCVYVERERERQTPGRIVGHREVPLHRRWEVGCLDFFSFFHRRWYFPIWRFQHSGGTHTHSTHTHQRIGERDD